MTLQTLLLTLLLSTSLINTSYADIEDGYYASNHRNYQNTIKEWRSSADQGDSEAQYNLGWMYDKGDGVLKDYKQAVKWYQKATDQGYADAQYNLGAMYIDGTGVLKDMTKAKYWIKKADEGDNAETSKLAKEIWDRFELWKY